VDAAGEVFHRQIKTPTLRNVDKRPRPDFVKAYMHNGYLKSLKEVVHFYNTRDALPRCQAGDPGEKVSCWPAPEHPETHEPEATGQPRAYQQTRRSDCRVPEDIDGWLHANRQVERLIMTTQNRWLIAAAGVLMQIAFGAVYAWSVFRIPLSQGHGWTIAEVTAAFEIAIFVVGLAAFAGGLWMKRSGPRPVAMRPRFSMDWARC
jgi:hypothetical protein